MIYRCRWTITHFVLFTTFYLVFGYVTQPEIKDLSGGHTIKGEDIMLECKVSSNKPNVLVEWDAPLNLNLTMDRVNITKSVQNLTLAGYLIRSFYKLQKATLEDKSTYYCRVADPDNIYDNKYDVLWVPVYDIEEHHIKFYPKYTTFDHTSTEITVSVRAHPEPTFHWFGHKMPKLSSSLKYFISRLDNNNQTIDQNSTSSRSSNGFINYQATLIFQNMLHEDFGNYTLIAQNKFETQKLVIPVNITGPPLTSLSVNSSNEELSVIKGQAVAYPKTNISWQFEPCDSLSCFSNVIHRESVDNFEQDEISFEEYGLRVVSYTSVNSSNSGIIRAMSENSLGKNSSMHYVFRMKNNFEIFAKNTILDDNSIKIETLFGETVEIICGVSLQDYYEEIRWYRSNSSFALDDVRGFNKYNIENIDAIYSSISRMSFKMKKDLDDIYICKATTMNGNVESKFIRVLAEEQPTLEIASNLQNKTIEAFLGYSWKFFCNVDGYPTPTIQWFKNNATFHPSGRIQIIDNNQTLAISYLESQDNGTYECVASNRFNQTVSKLVTLQTKENDFPWLWIIVSILVIFLVVVLVFATLKTYKELKLKRELKEAGLANFEEGKVEDLRPEIRVENQAELLPYNKKWEIPAENLILGKKLGSGAFGVVFEAQLRYSSDDTESAKTVAVKTVPKFAGYESIKALACELKIMAHIGKHVNIVNLIGACTKDIAKRKLLVVVEYCAFGSLHEHILQNRSNFLDQRNEEKNKFDFYINTCESNIKSENVHYSTIVFTRDSTSDDGSCNYKQPQKTNYQNSTGNISSKDLLTWSFQISKGMEYLASRNILHGDLATRNVLLSDNNVVKISDFGLSRNMYKNALYKKQAKGPLPVKWMAVESIGENIFSTQSDVWSFGIVLWELFSLGKTPYPGVPVDQNFYRLLFNGSRMGKPEFSTQELYEVMLNCWNANPALRPSFTELAGIIGSLLDENVVKHYVDMNSSNSVVDDNQDYLPMMNQLK